jgi:hypothetical protein
MNEPTIEDLIKRVKSLEEDWNNWKAIISDSAHKIGIAEGLSMSLQSDSIQTKVDLAHVSRQIATVINNQIETNKKLDEHGEMLRQVLELLRPN